MDDQEQEPPEADYSSAMGRLRLMIEESGDEGLQQALADADNESMMANQQEERDQHDRDFDEAHAWRYDDPTGQDADCEEVEESFAERSRMLDRQHAERDPEGAAEQRHFEAAARYLP